MDIVLNTFGVSLSRDNNGFVIINADGKQRVPVSGIKTIQLCKGVQITSDAILLAIENEIEVLFTDRGGNTIARVWSPKFGSISTIRKGQLAFTYSKDSVAWIKDIIVQKIETQQALILMMPAEEDRNQHVIDRTIARLEEYISKIKELQGEKVSDISYILRGLEGSASKLYFEAVNQFLPEEYRFEKRSQHPALDVTNAMLNYGYGILYGKIESALIKAGIDPYIGIMHRDEYNRPVLVYDIIEIYRMWIDYVVFTILAQRVITDEHYSIGEDGAYWLEALGRRILIQSVNDFLEEVVNVNGLQRSRITQISIYSQELAQMFKTYK